MNSTDTKPKSKAEREAEEKARRRAEAATIVAGLKQALGADEQLLGFARGRLAGGIRGKLSLGPEAFFAPFVNVGLTERRLVIQHINAETGRPGEILPHFYALGDIATLTFSDIETFGGESAARLTVRMRNDQHTRLRLRGQGNFESAQAIVEVFRSLMSAKRPATTPTQRVCATCHHILDQPFKFCPYCGQQQDLTAEAPVETPTATEEPERTYPPTPPGPTEPEFLDAVPYQDAPAFRGPTVDDGLDFLTPEPAPQPTVVPEPEPVATPEPEVEPEAVATPEPEAATTAPPAEDSAFETPSPFEGWSVDPGATSAEVEPSEPAVEIAPIQEDAAESFVIVGFAVDTEASVAEPSTAEVSTSATPADPVDSQTDVHTVGEATPTVHSEVEFALYSGEAATLRDLVVPPTVHPEAEFAPVPEPLAFTPEEAHSPVTVEAPPVESGPAPHSDPIPEPESVVAAATPDFLSPSPMVEAPQEEVGPETEARSVSPTEYDAPPAFESFSEPAPVAMVQEEFAASEPVAVAPTHESAGFVTEPVATEAPTPGPQDFEPFAPVNPMPPVAESGVSSEVAEPVTTPSGAPEPTWAEVPASPVEASPSEDRFAALLKEIRGGDAPAEATPAPPPTLERQDGPMSVNVHVNRPPIVVNETFTGRNADEVVGKLKARVLPELNFALRLMVNSFSNVRFAQEIVSRYNAAEKTNYPAPNSCWEFVQNAEKMGFATIQPNS